MLTKLLVTFLGIGNIKIASGTIASLISMLILLILKHYIQLNIFISVFIILLICSFFSIGNYIENLKIKDAKEIVIDEVLGIYLILIFININYEKFFFDIIIIFSLFRFFDIYKIYPINLIEKKYNNSFGIIFDDLVASIYTLLSFWIINNIFY